MNNNIDILKDEEVRELKNYTKYLKYSREKLINVGNKNWLITDHSGNAYQTLLNEINTINNYNNINTHVIKDIDWISEKHGFKTYDFLSMLSLNKEDCNVLVFISLDESVAKAKFRRYCTFSINYELKAIIRQPNEKIERLLKQNNFNISDEKTLETLKEIPSEEIENTMVRAFIKALNNSTNELKSEYFTNEEQELSSYIKELNNLIGLNETKKTLMEIINYLNISKKRNDLPCLNVAFLGNPGTGKTTVAKLVGKILSCMHVLGSYSPFVVASRETLVGSCIGHSEEKTLKMVNNAVGGVLFIDEAYALTSVDSSVDYGNQVIDVLVNQLDIHKHDLCVIFAGYKMEMQEFLKSNPGLNSRIPFQIEFNDYSSYELLEIFKNFMQDFTFEEEAKEILLRHFEIARKQKNFGNGRYIRNFCERLKIKQANRIMQSNETNIYKLTNEDLHNTINAMQKLPEKRIGFNISEQAEENCEE